MKRNAAGAGGPVRHRHRQDRPDNAGRLAEKRRRLHGLVPVELMHFGIVAH